MVNHLITFKLNLPVVLLYFCLCRFRLSNFLFINISSSLFIFWLFFLFSFFLLHFNPILDSLANYTERKKRDVFFIWKKSLKTFLEWNIGIWQKLVFTSFFNCNFWAWRKVPSLKTFLWRKKITKILNNGFLEKVLKYIKNG